MVLIPEKEWLTFKTRQDEILDQIKELKKPASAGIPVSHITAKEFMTAVRIGRTKFDQLVSENKIQVLKKRRKIYVSTKEIERYFTDRSIL